MASPEHRISTLRNVNTIALDFGASSRNLLYANSPNISKEIIKITKELTQAKTRKRLKKGVKRNTEKADDLTPISF